MFANTERDYQKKKKKKRNSSGFRKIAQKHKFCFILEFERMFDD